MAILPMLLPSGMCMCDCIARCSAEECQTSSAIIKDEPLSSMPSNQDGCKHCHARIATPEPAKQDHPPNRACSSSATTDSSQHQHPHKEHQPHCPTVTGGWIRAAAIFQLSAVDIVLSEATVLFAWNPITRTSSSVRPSIWIAPHPLYISHCALVI